MNKIALWAVVFGAAVMALSGCGDEGSDGPVLDLVIFTPDGVQIPPRASLETVRMSAVSMRGTQVLTQTELPYSAGGGAMESIPYGDELQLAVEGIDALGSVIDRGMTAPFAFGPDNNNLQLAVFYSGLDTFSPATALRFDEVVGMVPQEVRFQRQGRAGHGQVTLPSGLVMFTGGAILSNDGEQGLPWIDGDLKVEDVLNTVEIYDPRTGFFSERPGMVFPRAFHTTTLLMDGRVLVTGGIYLNSKDGGSVSLESLIPAEVFDPSQPSMPWKTVGGTVTARACHTATLRRADGRVVIIGGREIAAGQDAVLNTAEVFDPATDSFLSDAEPIEMADARADHTAVLLTTGLGAGGTILVIGGRNADGVLDSTEALRLVGAGGTKSVFSDGPKLVTGRYAHGSLRSSAEGGRLIVVAGGLGSDGEAVEGVEVLDAESGDDFGQIDRLAHPRGYASLIELPRSHDLLVIGGYDGSGAVGVPERIRFDGGGQPFSTVEVQGEMVTPRYLHQITPLNNGLILITGGSGSQGGQTSSFDEAEFYNPDDGPLGSGGASSVNDPDPNEPDFL